MNELQRMLTAWFSNMMAFLPEVTEAQRKRLRAESRRLIARAAGRTIADERGDLWDGCGMEFMAQMAIAGERAQASRAGAKPNAPSKADTPKPLPPGFDPRRN